ncbi:chorismate mutase [Lentilactobacillus farraginis]|uniref:Transport protein n=1 Tax=Lentilactobacillus farraginis DSM 18382 = JCM 14108 TaxID=1423743 RepID=X0PHE4_9LACO|nr:chorismate mutase [Lentilactobacillus farraginis]KRM08424.1 hypothetical protein FD41_GL000198 [Lentilactobacillus farraginis DSM 18382 = JCM 14108]GAF35876.1 transport protein [Lentilactobacillus farraginis DSM 18382 = JCM 14108]
MLMKADPAWNSSEELTEARKQINQLDESIVALLTKRFETAAKIGKIKEKQGLPVFDPDREEAVLEGVTALDPNRKTRQYIWNIYRSIMENTRQFEHDTKSDQNK